MKYYVAYYTGDESCSIHQAKDEREVWRQLVAERISEMGEDFWEYEVVDPDARAEFLVLAQAGKYEKALDILVEIFQENDTGIEVIPVVGKVNMASLVAKKLMGQMADDQWHLPLVNEDESIQHSESTLSEAVRRVW